MQPAAYAPLTARLIRRWPAFAEPELVRAIRSRPGLGADVRWFGTAYVAGFTFFIALIF